MTAKRAGFMILVIALILAINADAVASGKWTNLEELFAQAKGKTQWACTQVWIMS